MPRLCNLFPYLLSFSLFYFCVVLLRIIKKKRTPCSRSLPAQSRDRGRLDPPDVRGRFVGICNIFSRLPRRRRYSRFSLSPRLRLARERERARQMDAQNNGRSLYARKGGTFFNIFHLLDARHAATSCAAHKPFSATSAPETFFCKAARPNSSSSYK